MNKLSISKRAQIIGMLVEGMSMRSINRLTGASVNTITKLLSDAGAACAKHHDEVVRGITGNRNIQCDEIWSFVYAKDKNVAKAKAAPSGAGDAWTWTAIDSDSKVIVSYLLSADRDVASATEFMEDLRARLEGRPQITTDGLRSYVEAVALAFGRDVDFAQLVKVQVEVPSDTEGEDKPTIVTGTTKKSVEGWPDRALASTSYVERQNLTMRMGMRRFTRLTNGFSKRTEKLIAMLHLYFLHYNFCRIHNSLRVTPAMEAGIDDTVRTLEWIVSLVDANAPKPQKPGPKPGTKYLGSN